MATKATKKKTVRRESVTRLAQPVSRFPAHLLESDYLSPAQRKVYARAVPEKKKGKKETRSKASKETAGPGPATKARRARAKKTVATPATKETASE